VHDTWAARDLPVLDATVGLLEQSYMVTVTDIAARTGLDPSVVAKALETLDPAYVDFRKTTTGGDPRFWYVFKVTPEARRAVGQWPTPQSLANRLADELAAAAQHEPDSERQALLSYAARLIGDTLQDYTVRAAASVLAPALGQFELPELGELPLPDPMPDARPMPEPDAQPAPAVLPDLAALPEPGEGPGRPAAEEEETEAAPGARVALDDWQARPATEGWSRSQTWTGTDAWSLGGSWARDRPEPVSPASAPVPADEPQQAGQPRPAASAAASEGQAAAPAPSAGSGAASAPATSPAAPVSSPRPSWPAVDHSAHPRRDEADTDVDTDLDLAKKDAV
jgi:hypothetical protein